MISAFKVNQQKLSFFTIIITSFFSSRKTYDLGTHLNPLHKTIINSTGFHKTCFHEEISKPLEKNILSEAQEPCINRNLLTQTMAEEFSRMLQINYNAKNKLFCHHCAKTENLKTA